eukprot:scaffold40429_cov128-Skeletonema_dohrnii-CCMP3373.AAC.1
MRTKIESCDDEHHATLFSFCRILGVTPASTLPAIAVKDRTITITPCLLLLLLPSSCLGLAFSFSPRWHLNSGSSDSDLCKVQIEPSRTYMSCVAWSHAGAHAFYLMLDDGASRRLLLRAEQPAAPVQDRGLTPAPPPARTQWNMKDILYFEAPAQHPEYLLSNDNLNDERQLHPATHNNRNDDQQQQQRGGSFPPIR